MGLGSHTLVALLESLKDTMSSVRLRQDLAHRREISFGLCIAHPPSSSTLISLAQLVGLL